MRKKNVCFTVSIKDVCVLGRTEKGIPTLSQLYFLAIYFKSYFDFSTYEQLKTDKKHVRKDAVAPNGVLE